MRFSEEAAQDQRASQALVRGVERELAQAEMARDVDLPGLIGTLLQALLASLGGAPRRRLAALLPDLVSPLKGEAPRAQAFDDLVERIASASGVPEEGVRRASHAVFTELRRLIPAELGRSIAAELPQDLFLMWTSALPGSKGAEPARTRAVLPVSPELHGSHPVFEHVEQNVQLPEPVTGGAAFVATLCLALLGVSAADAAWIREALPLPLRDLLTRCTGERDEEATQFSQAEFSEALAAELGVTTDCALRVASMVFEGLSRAMGPEVACAIQERWPHPLRGLWPAAPGAQG